MIDRAPMNFWSVDVAEDGSAVLVAEGTPLIRDGKYSGVLSSELWALIRAGVTEIKSTPATTWVCMHASDFQVRVYDQDLFRNACISEVESSGLAGLYRLAERVIRETRWSELKTSSRDVP